MTIPLTPIKNTVTQAITVHAMIFASILLFLPLFHTLLSYLFFLHSQYFCAESQDFGTNCNSANECDIIPSRKGVRIRFMNIAIVDDEQKEIDTLLAILKDYAALEKLDFSYHIFHNAEEMLAAYHPYAYTAIFMDIYMTGMSGIEAAREILSLERRAILIFLTSSDEHMSEALSMHAYDYVDKPANRDRIFQVMNDVLLRQAEDYSAPKLTFLCEKKEISILFSDIVCIRTGKHNYLEIFDSVRKTYSARLTFSEVVQTLKADPRFLLIHRGILVNMDYIQKIDGELCHLKTDLTLQINLRNAKDIESTWQNYMLDSIRSERRERRRRK